MAPVFVGGRYWKSLRSVPIDELSADLSDFEGHYWNYLRLQTTWSKPFSAARWFADKFGVKVSFVDGAVAHIERDVAFRCAAISWMSFAAGLRLETPIQDLCTFDVCNGAFDHQWFLVHAEDSDREFGDAQRMREPTVRDDPKPKVFKRYFKSKPVSRASRKMANPRVIVGDQESEWLDDYLLTKVDHHTPVVVDVAPKKRTPRTTRKERARRDFDKWLEKLLPTAAATDLQFRWKYPAQPFASWVQAKAGGKGAYAQIQFIVWLSKLRDDWVNYNSAGFVVTATLFLLHYEIDWVGFIYNFLTKQTAFHCKDDMFVYPVPHTELVFIRNMEEFSMSNVRVHTAIQAPRGRFDVPMVIVYYRKKVYVVTAAFLDTVLPGLREESNVVVCPTFGDFLTFTNGHFDYLRGHLSLYDMYDDNHIFEDLPANPPTGIIDNVKLYMNISGGRRIQNRYGARGYLHQNQNTALAQVLQTELQDPGDASPDPDFVKILREMFAIPATITDSDLWKKTLGLPVNIVISVLGKILGLSEDTCAKVAAWAKQTLAAFSVLDGVSKILDWVKAIVTQGIPYVLTGDTTYLYAARDWQLWSVEVNSIAVEQGDPVKFNEVIGSTETHDLYMAKLNDHKMVGEALLVKCKNDNTLSGRVIANLKIIETAILNATSARRAMTLRRAPYGVLFFGDSSVLKSRTMLLTHVAWCAALGRKVSDYPSYTRSHTKHWDEYRLQRVVIKDEMGNLNPDYAEAAAEEVGELQNMINTMPWMTPQADIANKGKQFCAAELVIVSTNTRPDNPQGLLLGNQLTNNPAATLRRFDIIVEVAIDPRYRIPGTTQYDSERFGDAELVHPNIYMLYRATVVSNREVAYTRVFDAWIDEMSFISFVMHRVQTVHANSMKYTKANDRITTSQVCSHGTLSIHCKECRPEVLKPPVPEVEVEKPKTWREEWADWLSVMGTPEPKLEKPKNLDDFSYPDLAPLEVRGVYPSLEANALTVERFCETPVTQSNTKIDMGFGSSSHDNRPRRDRSRRTRTHNGARDAEVDVDAEQDIIDRLQMEELMNDNEEADNEQEEEESFIAPPEQSAAGVADDGETSLQMSDFTYYGLLWCFILSILRFSLYLCEDFVVARFEKSRYAIHRLITDVREEAKTAIDEVADTAEKRVAEFDDLISKRVVAMYERHKVNVHFILGFFGVGLSIMLARHILKPGIKTVLQGAESSSKVEKPSERVFENIFPKNVPLDARPTRPPPSFGVPKSSLPLQKNPNTTEKFRTSLLSNVVDVMLGTEDAVKNGTALHGYGLGLTGNIFAIPRHYVVPKQSDPLPQTIWMRVRRNQSPESSTAGLVDVPLTGLRSRARCVGAWIYICYSNLTFRDLTPYLRPSANLTEGLDLSLYNFGGVFNESITVDKYKAVFLGSEPHYEHLDRLANKVQNVARLRYYHDDGSEKVAVKGWCGSILFSESTTSIFGGHFGAHKETHESYVADFVVKPMDLFLGNVISQASDPELETLGDMPKDFDPQGLPSVDEKHYPEFLHLAGGVHWGRFLGYDRKLAMRPKKVSMPRSLLSQCVDEKFGECPFVEPDFKPFVNERGEYISARLIKRRTEMNSHVGRHNGIFECATDIVYDHLVGRLDFSKLIPLNLVDAINGDLNIHLKRTRFDTAAGFFLPGRKSDYFTRDESGVYHPDARYVERMYLYFEAASKNQRGWNINKLTDKYEPIKKTKLADGRGRIFNVCDAPLISCLRAFTAPIHGLIMDNRDTMFTALGTNAASHEWRTLYDYMLPNENFRPENILGADCVSFDALAHILEYVFRMMVRIMREIPAYCVPFTFFPGLPELPAYEWFWRLSSNVLRYPILWSGVLIEIIGVVPSGKSYTAEENTLICVIFMVASYLLVYSRNKLNSAASVDAHYEYWLTVRHEAPDFFDVVRAKFYGDDDIICPSVEILDWFKLNDLAQAWADLGMGLSDSAKTGKLHFEGAEHVTFLKRFFRVEYVNGTRYVFAPLETSSIHKMLSFYKSDDTVLTSSAHMGETLAAAQREMFFHGKKVYDDFHEWALTSMSTLPPLERDGVECVFKPRFKTWDDLLVDYDNKTMLIDTV